MPKVFLSVQGLRGIAALLVVVHHYNEIYGSIHKLAGGDAPWLLTYGHLSFFGAVGVPVFFVISGFVIGQQRFDLGPRGVYAFMAKRISRIVPLYWVMTLAYAYITINWTWPRLARSLAFIDQASGSPFPLLGVGWTLEYEMYFYLCFAAFVVSGITMLKRGGIGLLIAVFALLVSASLMTDAPALAFIGNTVILDFCAGLVIASTVKYPLVNRPWPLYLLAGLGVLAISATSLVPTYTMVRIMWSVGGFFLVLGLVSAEINGWTFLKSKPFQVLGAASYAIYLGHRVFQGSFVWPVWYWRWYEVIEPHVGLLMMIAGAAAFGVAVHYIFEIPANAFARRLLLLGDRGLEKGKLDNNRFAERPGRIVADVDGRGAVSATGT